MSQQQPQLPQLQLKEECLDPTKCFCPSSIKYYRIISAKNPSYALDCSKGMFDKNKLIIWSQHKGANQLWQFIAHQDGTFGIKSAENGGLLRANPESNAQAGSQCYISPQNGSIYEKWKIKPSKGQLKYGGFTICALLNGLALDVKGATMKDNSAVVLWPTKYQQNENQTWIICPVQGL